MILPPECNSSFSEKLVDAMVEYEVDDNRGSSTLASELLDNTREFFTSGAEKFRSNFGERNYEERPQQSAMAQAVAKALTEGSNLCVEAPTGVGKSFAYLVPLFFRASQCALPALVSTGTITLQEQLLHKDIPLLKKLTGLDVKCALAKGRRNYLCLRRFEMLCGEEKDALLPIPSMVVDLDRLQRGVDNGFSGEADDPSLRIDPQLWNMVCCETGNCMGPKCSFFRKCYYYRARKQWDEADIVVANHALFFTDLAMRNEDGTGSMLPNYGVVLIDEAHTLEDHAADHLGLHLAEYALIGTLNRLFNPDNAKGILMRGGSSYLELRKMMADLRAEAYRFFGTYSDYLDEQVA